MVRPNPGFILVSVLALGLLSGCAGVEIADQRPGVAEAKACLKAVDVTPPVIPGYQIHDCTNTGVWMVDRLDAAHPENPPLARYDFVNHDYAGPETGYGFVSIDSLGDALIVDYRATQKNLNATLKNGGKAG